jgi:hypothetical protein
MLHYFSVRAENSLTVLLVLVRKESYIYWKNVIYVKWTKIPFPCYFIILPKEALSREDLHLYPYILANFFTS